MEAAVLVLGLMTTAPATSARQAGPPVIAIARLGKGLGSVEVLVPALREAFSADVVVAPEIPIPSPAFDPGRGQYLTAPLLDALARAKRPEWDSLLGVADVDLFVPELNFAFGQGDPRRHVAVFSLARLHSENEALYRKRAATEAIHELGHAWGLAHCDDPSCVMWFSNTLSETDRKGTSFCRKHLAQLGRLRPSRLRS